MHTHDPQNIIEELRNNLAAHDKRLLFLFGAGTSSSINIAPEPTPGSKKSFIPLIPSIFLLTDACRQCVKALGEKFEAAWAQLEKQCADNGKSKNIEAILSLLLAKIEAIGLDEKLLGLDKKELENIEECIRRQIAKCVTPEEEKIPEGIPHVKFSSWLRKAKRNKSVEIFTTNYDLLIEKSLEYEQVPYFDGFVGAYEPFFLAECLENEKYLPSKLWIKLWKIHGSVNWGIKKINDQAIVVRKFGSDTGEMILPSQRKYNDSKKQPYTALLDRLGRAFNDDHSLLVTNGYSFGDQHINSILFSALENRPTSHIVALQFEDLTKDQEITRLALKKANLTVLGPNAGVIGGRYGEWRLLRPVDEKTHNFMDIAFDSNGAPGKDDELLLGRLRLGDFNWFCEFLMTMERKVGIS